VDFNRSVVADETELSEFVHEIADPRPGSADHLGQGFLAELGVDRLSVAVLTKIGEQQQKTRKPLFARIEQLVDQVSFDSAVASQQVGDE
jgi:hypothetical protein